MSDEQMQQLRQNKLVSSAVLNNRYGWCSHLWWFGIDWTELWWFLLSALSRKANQGFQEIDITVDGGFRRVVVNAGQPVRLNFHRKDPSSCLKRY